MTPEEIIAAINMGIQLIQLGVKLAGDSKQNAEWTPEQEAAFDAAIAAIGTKPQDQDTGK